MNDNAVAFSHWLSEYLQNMGVGASYIKPISTLVDLTIILLIAFVVDYVVKRFLVLSIKQVALKTKARWDDVLVDHKVFDQVAHMAPLLVLSWMVPTIYDNYPGVEKVFEEGLDIAIVIVVGMTFYRLIDAGTDYFAPNDDYKKLMFLSFGQLVKVFVAFMGVIIIIAILFDIKVGVIFGAIGTFTAILLLVFRDSILGFVASIQVASTKMVKIGDWIVMPKYEADGPIVEVNLTSSKIRNWDNTITTVPTYALVSSPVKNWDGMEQSGVRRIKRSINFNIKSVQFCTAEMLQRFERYQLLSAFLKNRELDIVNYNSENNVDTEVLLNGRRMTNVGIFREYLQLYLEAHPQISRDHTLMVRQLQPTANGLPLEMYCFSKEIRWVQYEGIQADIMDHIMAAATDFDLEIFQSPSGRDIIGLKNQGDA